MDTRNINSFINDHYTVVYKGAEVDENDLSTANEFLLADNHGSHGHSVLNSLFINTFAEEGDGVMVEAIASMKEVKPGDALQTVWLKTKATIIGWDIGNIGEIAQSYPLLQESGDLEIINQILLRQFLDPELVGKKEEIREELIKNVSKFFEVSKQLQNTGLLAEDKFLEMILQSLPDRIKSMKNSMDNAKNVYNRTFLIAGQNHLKHKIEDPRFSLEELYEFLKNRKVVILFPKDKSVGEMGREGNIAVMRIEARINLKAMGLI